MQIHGIQDSGENWLLNQVLHPVFCVPPAGKCFVFNISPLITNIPYLKPSRHKQYLGGGTVFGPVGPVRQPRPQVDVGQGNAGRCLEGGE